MEANDLKYCRLMSFFIFNMFKGYFLMCQYKIKQNPEYNRDRFNTLFPTWICGLLHNIIQ